MFRCTDRFNESRPPPPHPHEGEIQKGKIRKKEKTFCASPARWPDKTKERKTERKKERQKGMREGDSPKTSALVWMEQVYMAAANRCGRAWNARRHASLNVEINWPENGPYGCDAPSSKNHSMEFIFFLIKTCCLVYKPNSVPFTDWEQK